MAKQTAQFYARDTLEVARDLVGRYLVRRWRGELLVCRITETEAYIGRCDKACHAYHYRRTPRTETLFAPPGTAYIYLIYGMHHCLNFVTEAEGEPAAVLIRGGVPLHGGEVISRLRFGKGLADQSAYQRRNFLNGPGKLCRGLALTREQNGISLTGEELFVCDSLTDLGLPAEPPERIPAEVQAGKRIGIDYAEEAIHFPWRFYTAEL